MTDDPREVLKAAGVECAEAEDYRSWCRKHVRESPGFGLADAAVIALARLVARYKWQLKTAIDDDGEDDDQKRQQWVERELADLDRRWEAHNS